MLEFLHKPGGAIMKTGWSGGTPHFASFAVVFAALGISATAAAAKTPTVSEFLNAANAEYLIDTVPAGMHAFTNNDAPVMFVDNANGVVASVFVTAQSQLIISFQGTTGGLNFFVDPIAAAAQLVTGIGIFLDDAAGGVSSRVDIRERCHEHGWSPGILDRQHLCDRALPRRDRSGVRGTTDRTWWHWI